MLLTVKDIAARLNVSPSCVYQLIESGQLAHHRIGTGRGSIRVSENDLTAYLNSCRHVVAAASAPSPKQRMQLKHLRVH